MSQQQMWGGRFAALPGEIMQEINESIRIDQRLYREDIAGSLAHVAMLAKQGIIQPDEAEQISAGLRQVEQELAEGRLEFRSELEDIHMHVEARLGELIGPVAGKLHTGRSRNDQVATDFRLWVRRHCDLLQEEIAGLQNALEQQKTENTATIMPGFTHLQVAMPVTLARHLDVYCRMLERDAGRIADCRKRLNECPLGAGALAGSSYPLDRDCSARELGFDRPMPNTMDAVSDRDFALEYLSALSILATHLSRLGEELVLWSSYQFRFVKIADEFTTGSSMMPQKRNPDAAELLRGKAGHVIAQMIQLLIVLKGLPLTYSKDMQDDKKPVFEATDTVLLCLRAAAGMIRGMKANKEAMFEAVQQGYANATYLADWLVLQADIPFRQAHHIVGQLVARAEELGLKLEDLPLAEMQVVENRIDRSVYEALRYDVQKASGIPG
ncbi:argininosuccinate lyase [Candidatus Haliotispira prima]|uniref:Argininosuccinate lyase n=1 Tax=Candidatus Haliotispira prima TaxID=3034016 RepID=A0ABY8MHN1_9SPIO|nr:argininosuccinate lyase [Candidatus Haliotispira prima]